MLSLVGAIMGFSAELSEPAIYFRTNRGLPTAPSSRK